MKRLLCCVMALWCLAGYGLAQEGWTQDRWALVRAELTGDAPLPVPEDLRIFLPADALNPQGEERGLTVLLFGVDSPDMEENFGRADLMLLCRLDFETGGVRLLSLPEEVSVSLPELPGTVMLRYVNCFGGPRLLLRTLNASLNAGAFRYCAVNFQAFEDAVDILGGVELTLTEGEALALGMEPGENVLSGPDALRYVRLRRQGDGSARAQTLLSVIFHRLLAARSLQTVYRLMDQLLPLIDTNLTTRNLMDLALKIAGREHPGDLVTRSLAPGEDFTLDENARRECRSFLYGEEAP